LGVVKATERGTTMASFFGLSSSLKGNYSTSRGREESKDKNTLIKKTEQTHESSNSNI
jgi:hypothetical protein